MLDMYLYAVCLTVVARLFADVVLPRQAKDGQKEEQKRKQAPFFFVGQGGSRGYGARDSRECCHGSVAMAVRCNYSRGFFHKTQQMFLTNLQCTMYMYDGMSYFDVIILIMPTPSPCFCMLLYYCVNLAPFVVNTISSDPTSPNSIERPCGRSGTLARQEREATNNWWKRHIPFDRCVVVDGWKLEPFSQHMTLLFFQCFWSEFLCFSYVLLYIYVFLVVCVKQKNGVQVLKRNNLAIWTNGTLYYVGMCPSETGKPSTSHVIKV